MLICFTSSHRTAGFDLLERLERRATEITDAVTGSVLVGGAVVLATCNRFEAYLDVRTTAHADVPASIDASSDIRTMLETIAVAAEIDAAELTASSTTMHGHAVAEHLFAVSSGLESVVVGEGEIVGQVRRALHRARAAGSVTRDLDRLFQSASRTSRGVKNKTELPRAGRSIVRLALELAASRITDWANARVLLVGTGAYAGASLAALRERGATDVRVYSRTGRAEAFAASHAIQAVPDGGLVHAIAAADLILTCSVAPTVILDRTMLETATQVSETRPRRLVIDLGLPRNVDPAVASVDGVELLDLETISLHAPLEELCAAEDARTIVGEAAAAFTAQGSEAAVEPALVALRSHVFAVLDAEIERVRARGGETKQIEAAMRHLTGVLLHTPSVRARELARDGDAEAFVAGANAVFGVETDHASPLHAVDGDQAAS